VGVGLNFKKEEFMKRMFVFLASGVLMAVFAGCADKAPQHDHHSSNVSSDINYLDCH
jgi:hypothetical protein